VNDRLSNEQRNMVSKSLAGLQNSLLKRYNY